MRLYLLSNLILLPIPPARIKALLIFDKEAISHSPIFYIFFLFLKKISFNENIARLINLHLSLFIPYSWLDNISQLSFIISVRMYKNHEQIKTTQRK